MTALAETAGRFAVDRDETLFGVSGTAWFSADRAYRYLLTRCWNDAGQQMTWIMLNPSKAGAAEPDPTCTRTVGFTRREGFGGLRILNLHALVATDPAELRAHPDPVGPDNDAFLDEYADAPVVVAAWGVHGGRRGRDVARRLAVAGVRLWCLGMTEAGDPRHPLYLPATAQLRLWEPAS